MAHTSKAYLPSGRQQAGRSLQIAVTVCSTSNGAGPHLMAPPQNGAAREIISFAEPEAPTEQVAHLMSEAGYDLSSSGLRHLTNEARVCAFRVPAYCWQD